MTGVEAVSNGVQAFRQPKDQHARQTLTIIVFLLMLLLVGVALLCRIYGIGAVEPDAQNYQSVLSQVVAAVMGRGWFYYVTIASVLAVLALSANTSFADFPRLTRAIAMHDYLPHAFRIRGRRLLYSHGVYALVGFTAVLLIVFRGVTDRLIPLFAIGAFLAFTLSQAGMVVHWKKEGGPGSRRRAIINGVGATATGLTTCVVLVAKFAEGAWLTVVLVAGLLWLMLAIHKHYGGVQTAVEIHRPIQIRELQQPIVVIPIDRWTRIAEKSVQFALGLSKNIKIVHVDAEDASKELKAIWQEDIAAPIQRERGFVPDLVILPSPYRLILLPFLDFIAKLERDNPESQIAVLVPELVVSKWWQTPLHNHRAQLLKVLLLFRGGGRVLVINVPWYL